MGVRIVRLEFQGPPIGDFCFLQPTLVQKNIAKVVMGVRIVRLEFQGPPIGGFCFLQPTLVQKNIA